jgi:predicted nucleotide-binding protein (sugar kinase/HSP70/actin superfamily)
MTHYQISSEDSKTACPACGIREDTHEDRVHIQPHRKNRDTTNKASARRKKDFEYGDSSEISSSFLKGKKVYVPQMSIEGSALMAAAFRYAGIDAQVYPESDGETLRLGGQVTSGDECYPQIITMGNFYKILSDTNFDPEHSAFFIAAAGGPCRFGQYVPYMKKVFRDMGYPQIPIITLTSDSGYHVAGNFQRIAWYALVCGDILRKLLLKTRPYEMHPGETDKVHQESLQRIAHIIEAPTESSNTKIKALLNGLEEERDRFRNIAVQKDDKKLLIGVVGEIFCRLEEFSNNFLIRSIEKLGAEVWLSNISEWLHYTNFMHSERIKVLNRTFSKEMLKHKIKTTIQERDEKRLYAPFKEDFKGREEAAHSSDILNRGLPYLPYYGALGEMALNAGTSIYFHDKGVDGIIDISPFTCMNGIVSEAVYPKISRDHNNIPMRIFYFDGTETDLDRDLSIFLDLARTYRQKKKKVI